MVAQQGVGVELELRGDKAKANIQEVINQLDLLQQKIARLNSTGITLKSAGVSADVEKSAAAIKSASKESSAAVKRVGDNVQEQAKKSESVVISSANKSASAVEQSAHRASRAISGIGNVINGIGDFGGKLNQSITNLSNSLISPIRGVFSATKNFVATTVNESIGQIEKLELAQVGLQNHFKNDTSFDVESYMQKIRTTAERTQGLSAGDLADYIAQLAPLSKGNSNASFDATMGALKIIKYSGGNPSVDMMSIIKNIRDVVSKGRAYQMDLNQFNRAASLLAPMLEQQGLTQFIKKSSDGTTSLNITKNNYQGLLNAFAQLNYNEELNKVFNEMSNTLSGLMEQTKQSIQNDVMNLIKYSENNQESLLDLWKQFLEGNELDSARGEIKKYLQRGAVSLARFIKSLDKADIIRSAFDALKELGAYAKSELLPVVKELLGLSENASPTEVIKGLIRQIVDFGKGIMDGIKFFLGMLNKAKSLVEQFFGENSGFIMQALGWVKGFGKVGWDLVAGGGRLVTTFGNLLKSMSNFGRFINTKFGGSGGFWSGVGSIMTVGGLGMNVGDAMFDERSSEEKQLFNDVSAGITGIGVALQTGSPLFGAIAGVGTLLTKSLADKWKDVAKIREIVAKEQEASKTDLQGRMVTEVIKQMANKENPVFFANDPISQGAETDVRNWAVDNITPDMTPLEMQQKIRDKLIERIKYRTGHAKVAELSNKFLNDAKHNGPTQINENNADQYTEQIRKIWDYYEKYGFLQKMEGYENLPDNPTGKVMWKFLYGDGASNMIANIGSKEALDELVANLGRVDTAVQAIQDSDTELEWEVKLDPTSVDSMNEEMTRAMRAMGFDWVDGRGWVTTLHYRTEMEASGDLTPYEDNPKNYEKGYLSKTDVPRPGKFGNGTFVAPSFKNFDSEPSAEQKQKARVAYGFANDKSAVLDKLGQWNGAANNLNNISAQDRQNYDNDLDDVINRSLNMYNNGEFPTTYEQSLLVEALIRRYGTWGEVIKNRGQQTSSYLLQMVMPLVQASGKAQDLQAGYEAVFTMLTQPREAWEKDGRGDIGIYLDGINDAWREWLKKLYGDKELGTIRTGAYAVYRAGGGYIQNGPRARQPKPLFFNWGGSARGVDTVPAMLRPGEFVEKTTAVNKAGLGVMNALNEGDLTRAYKLLGAKLNTTNTNSYDSRRYNTTDSHNTTTNNFRFFNNSQSAVRTSYRGLRNIMALR